MTHAAAPSLVGTTLRLISAPLLMASMTLTGCDRLDQTTASVSQGDAGAAVPDDGELETRLATVLDWTYANRHPNLRDHAAWQIMHGALVYKQSLLIENEPGGERRPAIEYLLTGGKMKGWVFEPGSILDKATGRRGLRAILEAGSKTGQGHPEQWLANLAQCGLEPTQTIVVDGQTYTMADYVAQVQEDIARNLAREYSWTLVALTAYLPTSAQWTASDGQSWSIERLVEIETEQELSDSACGGTHRLDGLTLALKRHIAQGGKVEGVWAGAEQKVQDAIRAARQFQNPDGSFSSNYFQRGGKSADLMSDVAVTGHVFEFLTLALTDAELQEPWVKRAGARLCEILEKTKTIDLEFGALYHAAHGLDIYHTRRFGARTYSPKEPRSATPGSGL